MEDLMDIGMAKAEKVFVTDVLENMRSGGAQLSLTSSLGFRNPLVFDKHTDLKMNIACHTDVAGKREKGIRLNVETEVSTS